MGSMGRIMKNKLLLYILLLLDIISLFLPATLKPNPQTFQLDKINFWAIITENFSSFLLIVISVLLVFISYFWFKNVFNISFGILIGTYLQFILGYIKLSYIGKSFFSVYLYGFWLQFVLTIIIFILILSKPTNKDSPI